MRPLRLLPAAVVLGVVAAGPALAHPFGPPVEAAVTAERETVTVVWTAADDDLFALGQRTGALAQRQTFVFDDGVPVASEGSPSLQQQLASAPPVREYLASRITVGQDGSPCRLADVATERIYDDGARLVFRCPEPVSAVELEITALLDLDPNYRTVGIGGRGARTLHTAAEPRQVLDLAAPADRSGAAVALAASAAVLVAAVLAVGLGLRRRRVQRPPTG